MTVRNTSFVMGLALTGGMLGLSVPASSHAAIIAQYTFDGNSLTSSDTLGGSTASAITEGPHDIMALTSAADEGHPIPAYKFDGRTSGTTANQTSAQYKANSIDKGDYLTFTVTAESGLLPALDQLSLDQASDAVTSGGGGCYRSRLCPQQRR